MTDDRAVSAYGRVRSAYGWALLVAGSFAGIVTFLMMLLVVANVLLRSIADAPIDGTLELTQSALVILIFLSLALTQYEGGHIHVVILTQRLPARLRTAVRFLAMVLGLVFFAWATKGAFDFALRSYTINEQEWGAIRFPIWPVKFVVFVGLLALAIQFLIDAVGVLVGELPDDEDAVKEEHL
ncbi:TRAP transporter small permease subunit [Acuticoccus mangrovi]|uniref:TRAP transporter small permease protein n=1 Tax=Acuticoccus mangrovi TaxID=2796142 RepID=A0A934IQ60_9HYPH|nr:TRAP transporter small permease [Acuticoccus mangrovi]MBJ3778037.1 TRAP transporter small permease [Acuticoccus mangrovi]